MALERVIVGMIEMIKDLGYMEETNTRRIQNISFTNTLCLIESWNNEHLMTLELRDG
jgi:hypothetical protein